MSSLGIFDEDQNGRFLSKKKSAISVLVVGILDWKTVFNQCVNELFIELYNK